MGLPSGPIISPGLITIGNNINKTFLISFNKFYLRTCPPPLIGLPLESTPEPPPGMNVVPPWIGLPSGPITSPGLL